MWQVVVLTTLLGGETYWKMICDSFMEDRKPEAKQAAKEEKCL
jgi:hypothetical protein